MWENEKEDFPDRRIRGTRDLRIQKTITSKSNSIENSFYRRFALRSPALKFFDKADPIERRLRVEIWTSRISSIPVRNTCGTHSIAPSSKENGLKRIKLTNRWSSEAQAFATRCRSDWCRSRFWCRALNCHWSLPSRLRTREQNKVKVGFWRTIG